MWTANGCSVKARSLPRANPAERAPGGLRRCLPLLAWLAWAAGCSSGGLTSVDLQPLEGHDWRLVSIDGQPVAATLVPPPDLRFRRDRVSGFAGCNRFLSTLTVVGGELRFGPMGQTRKLCPAAENQLEQEYLQRLPLMRRIEPDEPLLRLSGSGHELLFRKS